MSASITREQLIDAAKKHVAKRRRTVWDARRLIAPLRDRVIRIVMDDGQFPDAVRFGVLEDVVHRPESGFALVVRQFSDSSGREARRRTRGSGQRRTLPLALVKELPTELAFLFRPPMEWPMPPAFLPCPSGCGEQEGRFCSRCGLVLRRGAFLGEGFIVVQQLLRRIAKHELAQAHACTADCGAYVLIGDSRCSKCGTVTW